MSLRTISLFIYSSRNQEHQSVATREVQFQLFSFYFYCVCCLLCVPVSHRKLLTLWQPWYNSSLTSRPSFCDSYERCFCVCVCSYVGVPSQTQRTSWTIPTHKSPRAVLPAAAQQQQQQQQQQRNNTGEPRMGSTYIPTGRNVCVPSSQLATPPGPQVY